MHVPRMAIVLVALAAHTASCKPRSGKQLDDSCDDDKECASELNCVPGVRESKVCLKPCGSSAAERAGARPDDPPEDTSCPTGWECRATLTSIVTDRDGRKMRGFGGLQDRPYCVPVGWKPKDLPADLPPSDLPPSDVPASN